MYARVYINGSDANGWRYVLVAADNDETTHALGLKRWPTRRGAVEAGRLRAHQLRLAVVNG